MRFLILRPAFEFYINKEDWIKFRGYGMNKVCMLQDLPQSWSTPSFLSPFGVWGSMMMCDEHPEPDLDSLAPDGPYLQDPAITLCRTLSGCQFSRTISYSRSTPVSIGHQLSVKNLGYSESKNELT